MYFIKPAFAQLQPKATIERQYDFANSVYGFSSLGQFTQTLVPLAFWIAAMMVVFYFIIAAIELITSQGDKAHIVSARAKIYHSIIGFILLIAIFLIMQYIIPALLKDSATGMTTNFKII
jgi:hypothetical protein